MSEVIKVENLSKRYIISHQKRERYTALRDVLTESAKKWGQRVLNPFAKNANSDPAREEFWALKDVSFDIRQGDRVGIIGRNGAGKSTLLKVLSRITEPTTGRVTLRGRVASLLEVGTGFHPELTGRENIFLNGAILGMTRVEIKKKFDEIVDFAEVEKFLDTPVKRYSSGMYVRLAFAVAAHLEPEILVVDEVLAVGDAQFQKKCLGKMEDIGKEGRTVLFVSHNMAAIENLCDICICLKDGCILTKGRTKDVILSYLSPENNQVSGNLENRKDREGNGKIRTTKVVVRNSQGIEANFIHMGEPFSVEVYYKGTATNAIAGVILSNGWIEQLMRAYSFESYPDVLNLNTGKFTCYFEKNYLTGREYGISIWLGQTGECMDYIANCINLSIEPADVYKTGKKPDPKGGLFFTEHKWDFSGN